MCVVCVFVVMWQSLQDKPVTVYGDGSQTRSFQYVSDLVAGLYALMNSNYTMPVRVRCLLLLLLLVELDPPTNSLVWCR